jgi:hypothetical protein
MTRPALANGWRRISPRTGGRKMDLTSTNSFAAKFHPTNLAWGAKGVLDLAWIRALAPR